MGLTEAWEVRRSAMPPDLKYVALMLAMMYDPAKRDNIFVGVEALARDLGLHRVTVSRRLAALDRLGVFPVVRRGGRHASSRTGKVVPRPARRTYVREALAQFALEARADHVAPALHDAPQPAASSSQSLRGGGASSSDAATHKETNANKETTTEQPTKIPGNRASRCDRAAVETPAHPHCNVQVAETSINIGAEAFAYLPQRLCGVPLFTDANVFGRRKEA